MDAAGISPVELAAARARGEMWSLVDVRASPEWREGVIEGSLPLGPDDLALRLSDRGVPSDARIAVICASGQRAILAAHTLAAAGYGGAQPLLGGLRAWRAAGLPLVPVTLAQQDDVETGLTALEQQRFARHLSLREVGVQGQLALRQARVLIVGCGGLGSPAALYLAAAGVGCLGLVDGDSVDLSNLQRQIIHAESRMGQPKVESALVALRGIDSNIRVEMWRQDLDARLAAELVPQWDVIIDGTDRLATRYLLSDACVLAGKPYVYAAVHRFEGQVAVLAPSRGGPCYRCLFPEPPASGVLPACGETGVLGVVPGVIGLLQATEAIKWIVGLGDPLVGRMVTWDARDMAFRVLRTPRRSDCRHCATVSG